MGIVRNIFLVLVVLAAILVLATVVLPGSQSRSGVGPLNSAHWHADFLVVMNGEVINFNQPKYMVRSPFVHVEGDNVGGAGRVMHLHATGVPLGMFFDSVNMRLDANCFRLDDGRALCNQGKNALRMYVNGQPNSEYGDYRPKDGDRILVSYGDYTEAQLNEQMNGVSNYAKTLSRIG